MHNGCRVNQLTEGEHSYLRAGADHHGRLRSHPGLTRGLQDGRSAFAGRTRRPGCGVVPAGPGQRRCGTMARQFRRFGRHSATILPQTTAWISYDSLRCGAGRLQSSCVANSRNGPLNLPPSGPKRSRPCCFPRRRVGTSPLSVPALTNFSNSDRRRPHPQQAGPQHAGPPRSCACPPGLVARTNALMNLPSTCGASASTSMPLPVRNSRASSTR